MTLPDLLALAGASLDVVEVVTGIDRGKRESVTGYQSLEDLDVCVAADGTRVYLRGDDVALVYVGRDALPTGTDHAALVAAVESEGKELRSRQGKRATMHVVAGRGIAWSELDGAVGFLEIFPPMRFKEYRKAIYREPGTFIR